MGVHFHVFYELHLGLTVTSYLLCAHSSFEHPAVQTVLFAPGMCRLFYCTCKTFPPAFSPNPLELAPADDRRCFTPMLMQFAQLSCLPQTSRAYVHTHLRASKAPLQAISRDQGMPLCLGPLSFGGQLSVLQFIGQLSNTRSYPSTMLL